MKSRRVQSYFASLFLLLATITPQSLAQTVSDVFSFDGTSSLANPGMTLAQSRDGKLYGTIYGPNGSPGSVFDVSTAGVTKVIYQLSQALGYEPTVGLTLGTDGNFYGVTSNGGSGNLGVLFRVTPKGTYTVLHDFAGAGDGGGPEASPIEATDGNFYGTTNGGCCLASTIYRYSRSAGFSTIYTYDHAHGMWANSPMQGSDGNLHVMAFEGGVNNNGTVATLTTSGTLVNYYAFPGGAGGSVPAGGLIEATDGNYYGITEQGGVLGQGGGFGTIFKMTPTGKVTIVYIFCNDSHTCADGAYPGGGLVQATDGFLYGTATAGGSSGFGTVFRTTTNGQFTTLYSFIPDVGETPSASLSQDTNGLLYGSAQFGGAFGFGSIYSVNAGLPPFVKLVNPEGKAGQTVQILGQGFTGATSVTFNGLKATKFSVVEDTYMTAVVPVGAKSGPVIVTTPSGKLKSNVNFAMIK